MTEKTEKKLKKEQRNINLCLMYRAGDELAGEALLKENKNFINRVVYRQKHLYGPCYDYEDALIDAQLEMLNRAKLFNPADGKFSQYMGMNMQHEIVRKAQMINMPLYVPQHAQVGAYVSEKKGEVEPENKSYAQAKKMANKMNFQSIELALENLGEDPFMDVDFSTEDYAVQNAVIHEIMNAAKDVLSEREQTALYKHIIGATFKDIGKSLNISNEGARKVYLRAEDKIRKSLVKRKLMTKEQYDALKEEKRKMKK